jgi:hypothetical protein
MGERFHLVRGAAAGLVGDGMAGEQAACPHEGNAVGHIDGQRIGEDGPEDVLGGARHGGSRLAGRDEYEVAVAQTVVPARHPQGTTVQGEMAADEAVGIGGGETGSENGGGGAAQAGAVPAPAQCP